MAGSSKRNTLAPTQVGIGKITNLLKDSLSFSYGVGPHSDLMETLLINTAEFAEQSVQSWMYYFVATKTDNISELCKIPYIVFSHRKTI